MSVARLDRLLGHGSGDAPVDGTEGEARQLTRRRARRMDARADAPILLTLAAVALLVRLVPVLRGGGLLGLMGYDDGVYFGTALALVHGVLPYRDFLLLLPPGMPVALAPFALLGSIIGDPNAFALSRLASMGLGAVTTVLVALTAGRHSRSAGIVAGALYAVWSAAVFAERNPDLHVLENALLVLALLLLARPGRVDVRRAAMVGVVLGLATSVQLWHGVSVVVVLWWVAARADGRGWARLRPVITLGAAAVIAFSVVCLPFFIAAPGNIVRDVLIDQVARPRTGASIIDRLRSLDGLNLGAGLAGLLRYTRSTVAVITIIATGVALLLATARSLTWTRLWVVMALVQTLVILTVPSFHVDYTSFAAPAASLALGTALASAVGWLRRRAPGRVAVPRAGWAIVALGLVVLAGSSTIHPAGRRLALAGVERDVANVRCVTSSSPSLLILTSTLPRDLAAGCPITLDPSGTVYDSDRGHLSRSSPRRSAPGFQAAMRDWYTSGGAAIFLSGSPNDLSAATRAVIDHDLPVVRHDGPITVRLAAAP